MIPPPDIWDLPKGPLYFMKKSFPPLTARTHHYIFARKEVPPYCAQKNEYPTALEAHLWAY